MKKVFFSWQSDIDDYRRTIGEALDIAAEGLGDIRIDSATRDEIGAVEIDNKIFEKIKSCDFFVADLSIIGHVGKKRRKSPNPNVLYETGFALGNRGEDRLFLVAQKELSGSDKFPFDLRNRRIAFYDLKQKGIEKVISRDLRNFFELRLALSVTQSGSATKILLKDKIVRWGNWSRLIPSFHANITIDNFDNDKPNYIERVTLFGTDAPGDPWRSSQFLAGNQNINQRFRVEPHDKVDVGVYLNEGQGRSTRLGVPMPSLDRDKARLQFELADGTVLNYDVKIAGSHS